MKWNKKSRCGREKYMAIVGRKMRGRGHAMGENGQNSVKKNMREEAGEGRG